MAEIIEMPTLKEKQNNKVTQNTKETLVVQLINIAEEGDKGAILDYLEKLSSIYRKRKELDVKELVEIMDIYAYFRSNLDEVTYLERLERWGKENCYFLDMGAKIMSQTYEQLALKIHHTLSEEQKNLIVLAVNRIVEYVKQGATATISFLNDKIPSFQIIVDQDNYNGEMSDQMVTAFSYQYVTYGTVKGVIKDKDGCRIFGFYFDTDGIESMTEDDIILEFYTSEDGIEFKLEENAEIIDLLEGDA